MYQKILSTIAGVLGSIIGYAFGGWSTLLEVVLFAIVLDYISGILASIKDGTGLSSRIGYWGIMKKVAMVLIIAFCHRLDLLFGTDYIMIGAMWACLSNETISIAENYGRLGFWMPNQVKQIIAVLKDKGNVDH